MKKLIIFLVLCCTPLLLDPYYYEITYAGIVVCSDAQSNVTKAELSSPPQDGCLYFNHGQNISGTKFDQIKTLINAQPVRYLKVLSGVPVEKSPQEKVDADDALAAEIDATIRLEAKAVYDGNQSFPIAIRCFAKLMVDEINQVRTDPLTVKPARTLAQAKTAIQNCVDQKSADE